MAEARRRAAANGLRAWWRRLLGKEDPDVARRRWLRESGRIIEGEVLEVSPTETGQGVLVRYRYEVANVEYESLDVVDAPGHRHWPGQRASIRYDRRRPSNSILG
ncbi:MAG: hypothetical protein CFK52_07285 [Chloracidobacterium sp. CP2_5A]|nr:MAG: hypothetical protein CFK52_07285 [Chloracidobacterium sp. CP2_5A]